MCKILNFLKKIEQEAPSIYNIGAFIVVLFSVICLIITVTCYIFKQDKTIHVHQVELVLSSSTNQNNTTSAMVLCADTVLYNLTSNQLEELVQPVIDSLQNIVSLHELELSEQYKFLIEQREKDNYLLTFGGGIVTLILSILGFFGFSNFNSIEKKAKEIAETTASSQINKFSEKKMQQTIVDTVKKIPKDIYEAAKETFDDNIKKLVDEKAKESTDSRLKDYEENSLENIIVSNLKKEDLQGQVCKILTDPLSKEVKKQVLPDLQNGIDKVEDSIKDINNNKQSIEKFSEHISYIEYYFSELCKNTSFEYKTYDNTPNKSIPSVQESVENSTTDKDENSNEQVLFQD